jgi:DNA (cytosine-5)-methyltransferase 1
MTAYYNEIEPNAAAWLRTLISEGWIAPGHVDERSIVDVRPSDLDGFEQCHFFAGIGGWSLALRSTGWSDHRPVWTGSCPCQPFSNAGRKGGFDDARHLWPEFKRLIAERCPPVVFGEQVASAADWLRLVRGDLEALEYAVGAMPIEAASAGADHLRDRFWFVADDGGRRRAGSREGQVEQPRRAEAIGPSDPGNVVNRDGQRLAVGSLAEIERGDLRQEGAAATETSDRGIALANAPSERGDGCKNPAGETGRDVVEGSSGINVGDTSGPGAGRDSGSIPGTQAEGRGERELNGNLHQPIELAGSAFDWVIGADGKARRVKSGVRLLAHGIPNRVGLLRGFGNAIDPRPAAAFITAATEILDAA